MDPDTAGLPRRLARARQVLGFAEAAGDQSAILITGTVLAELLDQASEQGIEAGSSAVPAARRGPSTTGTPA